jgi:peptidyl-prolyl cis-trans isomerase B (cyclophilin B)
VKAVSKFKETASLPILEKLMDLEDKILTEEVSKAIFEISGNNTFISKVKKGELFRKHFIFEEIKKLSSRESVVLETEIGKITLELNSDFAPVTVANFLELVGKGFYDGMEFHRVIGNFVAQAGCPLGNGWSGAGYQINCEYSPLRYEVGTLGMALSGKDTGGSQFFITHSPQPHLNGSYTILGKVVFGMEFLEKAQIGTKILSIKRV